MLAQKITRENDGGVKPAKNASSSGTPAMMFKAIKIQKKIVLVFAPFAIVFITCQRLYL